MVTQRSKEERDLCEDEIHIENILVSNEVEKYYVHLHVLSLLQVNCHSSLKIKWFISLSHTSTLKVRFRKRYSLASDCDACLENVIASMILASSSCPALLFGSRQNRRCLLTWASNLCIHRLNTAHLNWVGSCHIRRLWNICWKVVNSPPLCKVINQDYNHHGCDAIVKAFFFDVSYFLVVSCFQAGQFPGSMQAVSEKLSFLHIYKNSLCKVVCYLGLPFPGDFLIEQMRLFRKVIISSYL